ncbi:MAG: FHA domain-containing protein [Propionibacteriaceae bacterium]|nr:FHA domain-containing protein [Propionibacteriaceae bacterium]
MSEPIAAWRATYTPGRWVVMSGPRSLVVLPDAPPRVSELLNRFWDDVLNATSVQHMAELLSARNLSQLPHFGLLFWDEVGVHALTRGDVRFVDAKAQVPLASGPEPVTWTEAMLGPDGVLRLDLEPIDPARVLYLPLAVGAVTASSVILELSPEARFSSTQTALLTAPQGGEQHEVVVETTDTWALQQDALDHGEAHQPEPEPEPSGHDGVPVAQASPSDEGPELAGAAAGLAAGAAAGAMVPPAPPIAFVPGDGPGPEAAGLPHEPAAEVAEDLAEVPDFSAPAEGFDDPVLGSAEEPVRVEPHEEPVAEPVEGVADLAEVPDFSAPAEGFDDPVLGSAEEPARVEQHAETAAGPADGVVEKPIIGGDPAAAADAPVEIPEVPAALLHDQAAPVEPSGEPPVFVSGFTPAEQEPPADLPAAQEPVEHAPSPVGEPEVPVFVPSEGVAPVVEPPVGVDAPPVVGEPEVPVFVPSEGVAAVAGQPAEVDLEVPSAVADETPGAPEFSPAAPAPAYDLPELDPVDQAVAPAASPGREPVVELPELGPVEYSQPGVPAPQVIAQPAPVPLPQMPPPSVTHAVVPPPAGGLVSATVCQVGHPNPPGSMACRQCNRPVGSISRLVPRPVLAVVRSSFGTSLELSAPILVGRAPDTRGDTSVQIMKVPSPNTDISRSHLRLQGNEWTIEVMDLNSTNGSIVAIPGQAPARLIPGQAMAVPLGTIVDLGDGVQIRIDPPR